MEYAGNTVKDFFTETLPAKWDEFWDDVGNFFTETIPFALCYAAGKDAVFFTETLPEKWHGFWSGIGEKISGFFSGVWDKITGSASAGYQSATAHAEGSIMTSPHVGLVAEDGAEAIIPLSNKRRDRGIGLWEQAGNILGVKPYADGEITGSTAVPRTEGIGGMAVPVTAELQVEQADNPREKRCSTATR